MLFVFVIYIFIFIITPHDINSENLNQFNLFLNKYLCGSSLPEISDKFSFKMKVVWCLSWIINLCIFIILLMIFLFTFKKEEILSIYKNFYSSHLGEKKNKFVYFKQILIGFGLMLLCIFGEINSYTYLSYNKEFSLFYQKIYPSFILFLITNILVIYYMILWVVLNFYFIF